MAFLCGTAPEFEVSGIGTGGALIGRYYEPKGCGKVNAVLPRIVCKITPLLGGLRDAPGHAQR